MSDLCGWRRIVSSLKPGELWWKCNSKFVDREVAWRDVTDRVS